MWTVASTSRGSSFSEPSRNETAFTSFGAATGSKFVGPEAPIMSPALMRPQSPRFEARDTGKESHPLAMPDTGRVSMHRPERPKPVSPSVIQAGSSTHHARSSHAKLPHSVVSESAASSPDFRRGNTKTASKRRREYRSKKQVQEVHHSGSLTEATQHPPGPAVPVHGYSAVVVGDASSSENSLEQPSTTSQPGAAFHHVE